MAFCGSCVVFLWLLRQEVILLGKGSLRGGGGRGRRGARGGGGGGEWK